MLKILILGLVMSVVGVIVVGLVGPTLYNEGGYLGKISCALATLFCLFGGGWFTFTLATWED